MTILIVSNDAGGANIIASYIANKNLECIYHIQGPALKIFTERLGKDIVQIDSLDLAVKLCSHVICGSGDQSLLEKKAIFEAKKRKKRVVCFLDHWVNYRERFLFNGQLILPDEIVVSDEAAFNLAKSIFMNTPITRERNYYAEELLRKIKEIESKVIKTEKIRVLYLAEPIKNYNSNIEGLKEGFKYDEFETMKFAFTRLNSLFREIEEVVIRPHPSESQEKYEEVVKILGGKYLIRSNIDLNIEIARADVIVGYETAAMMIAFLAKKRVLSAIPPGGGYCRLPIDDMEYIRDF